MRKVKNHNFNGVSYRIDIDPNVAAFCEEPKLKKKYKPEICIFEKIDTKEGLETLIHESLHASDWSASEERVERTARDISSFLWRLGFRR